MRSPQRPLHAASASARKRNTHSGSSAFASLITGDFTVLYRRFPAIAALAVATFAASLALAAPKPKAKPDPNAPTPWDNLDYGPFLSASILAKQPANNMTYKGVAVKLGKVKVDGKETDAAICFDTQLMRVSAGWTGDFLRLRNVAFTGEHGPCPTVAGDVKFGTRNAVAWAQKDGSFIDPRVALYGEAFGGMPRDYLHYKGLYRHGDQVVFSYSVNGMDVLETPGVKQAGEAAVFSRTFDVAPSSIAQTTIIAVSDHAGGMMIAGRGPGFASI